MKITDPTGFHEYDVTQALSQFVNTLSHELCGAITGV
jgi:hypothetical protein